MNDIQRSAKTARDQPIITQEELDAEAEKKRINDMMKKAMEAYPYGYPFMGY